jgi:hypothetical protein
MLAHVFNPTETKKNGPARMPANTPARRSVARFTAASAVLPVTSQKVRRRPTASTAIRIADGCGCRARATATLHG